MRYCRWILALLLIAPTKISGFASTVVISEIQTGSSSSGSQEFIELYNPTGQEVALSGWKVQYKSATAENTDSAWSTKSTLEGSITGHGYYLIAPEAYLAEADAFMSSGLAASGGHIRLVDHNGQTIDLLGWGTANAPENQAATPPAAGQSLERLPGERAPRGGNGHDTGNNAADFIQRTNPEPQGTTSPTEFPMLESEWDVQDEESTATDEVEVAITELLVDPATPLSDAADEFIELYNEGDEPADLSGYQLKTGSQFRDSYTIGSLIIQPGNYAVLYSKQTHLSLTNSGGSAKLLSPEGSVVAEAAEYEEAPEGESWSAFDDGWQWTLTATPGQDNRLEVAPPEVAAAKAAKTKKAKSAKTAKAKAAGKSSKATTRVAGSKSGGTNTSAPEATAAARTTDPASRGLLIGALGLTICYAIYEYRHDIRNYIIRARRKLASWRETGPPA
jgi:hypothetical protein